jgi:adenylate cyclase
LERRLAAILAADVVGYSRLVRADEEGTIRSVATLISDVFEPAIARYQGRVFKKMGDAVLAEFQSSVNAARCAIEVQQAIAGRQADVPADRRVVFRMGLHVGDIIIDGDDIQGDGVNIAARIEGIAPAGAVCISDDLLRQVEGRIEASFEDMGPQRLKNIASPITVYRLRLDDGGRHRIVTPLSTRVRRFKWPVAAAVLLVAAAGALALFRLLPADGPSPAGAQRQADRSPDIPSVKPSVAVLPFVNVNAGNDQEYFADGLTDDLITDLSKVSGLFVIARNTVFTFKRSEAPAQEVAAQLKVRYVVEGSIRRAGERVRVNARLVDGSNGEQLWAERYDRGITNIFAVQDDLVSRIVSALAVKLTQTEQKQLAPRPVPAFRAYDLYLQAREGYFSRDQGRMRQALRMFAQSWQADPNFAKPYAGYALLAADIWRLSSLREAMTGASARKSAEVAARKALALDPTLADAYSVLSIMRVVESDYEEATKLATRAVDLEPNNAEAYTALAIVNGYAGHREAALRAIRTSMRLNPRPSPYHLTYYGWALFLNRQYAEAANVLGPIADTPDRGIGDAPREILAMAYAELGRKTEARAQIDAMLKVEPYLNIAYYRARYSHHADKSDLRHRLEALRKAGMPEWPFGFKGDPARRLDDAALRALIDKSTWTGTDRGRREFVQEFGANDSAVYAGSNTMFNGSAFVREGELCERFGGFIMSRDLCGPVYRNAGGRAANNDEFVYVNPATVRYFSSTRKP